MPTDYKCHQCALHFSVGRYHYHRIDSGFGGRVLLACEACGTQHAIERALPDRGPEFYAVHSLIVESLPASATQKVLQWLRRERRALKLDEAMAVVRQPPFTLIAATWEERALKIRKELEPLGVVVRCEFVEDRKNPNFGPLQHDRVLYHSMPRRGDQQPEWLVAGQAAGDFESLPCQHCGAVGTLLEDFLSESSCPSCRGGQLQAESSWIT